MSDDERMPTVLFINGYRIGFFSADFDEPPHVHVTKGGNSAKFWLDPLGLADNVGFRRHDLGDIIGILEEHREELLKAWHEYFRKNSGD